MKKPFNKGALVSAALLLIASLLPFLSILVIATLWISYSSYTKIKKSGERGQWLSIIVMILSLLGVCALLVGFVQAPKDNAVTIFFYAMASLIFGMIVSSKI